MRLETAATLIVLATTATPAIANSCAPFLQNKGGANTLVMTTLNKNSVASFATLNMVHQDAIIPRPGQPIFRAERYVSTPQNQPQIFSDRMRGSQRFSVTSPDQISLTITVADTPQVTLVLRSWGNVSQTFPVTCTATGGMYGPGGDVSYLFRFTAGTPVL